MMDRAATTADVGETWWREGCGKAKDPAFNDGAPCMVKKGLNGLMMRTTAGGRSVAVAGNAVRMTRDVALNP